MPTKHSRLPMSTNCSHGQHISKPARTGGTHISEELLHELGLARDGGSLDGVLPQLVLLGQGNRLLPPLVLSVDARSNLTEEDQVVLLKPGRKLDRLVIVVVLDRVAQGLVVFLFNEQIVDGVVDGPLVLRLHVEQEWL